MRKKRGGAARNTIPLSTAPALLMPTRRASTYAPSPHSTHDTNCTKLSASTRLPVSQMIGAASRPLPRRFSE